jgi:hypothetical protein
MTTRTSTSRELYVCVLVVLLIGVPSAQARTAAPDAPCGGQANSRTYVDERGDATIDRRGRQRPGGLDIHNVTVSNSDAGRIHFSIRIPPRATDGSVRMRTRWR